MKQTFEFSVPVLIVGGGACGAAAALAARDAGLEPLLIEQDDNPTGSTGMSQGLFCAAGTHFQREAGIEDSPEIFFQDIQKKTKGMADPVISRLISEGSAKTLEWLVQRHNFPWTLDLRFKPSYGNSRARIHGWAGHSGKDMVQWFHRRLSDVEVDVLLNTKLVDIIIGDDGEIIGAVIKGGDGESQTIGCDALILASGGFGANQSMTQKFMPETKAFRFNGHEGSEGDAVLIGERLGAAVGDMGSYQGYAMLADPVGISVPPNVLIEGGVIVNSLGRRFTDESDDIAGMVLPLSEQPGGTGWVVFDARICGECEHIPEMQELKKLGVIQTASSIEIMADRMGVSEQSLRDTFLSIRNAVENGGADSLGRNWSNSVSALSESFHYIRVTGALYHTQGGLQIDSEARVVRRDGRSFSNLFAGGGAARSVSGPSSWGYLPAMGLTTAVVLGGIAGKNAAKIARKLA
ncbi:FAD-dependent oxidoreductase [Hirschia baltica]|uniref:Fumarate reductase/succinate dehydrogenase flavoprotein domain protein n=1 Tax=Hirschia baltica (strain ATCC 49814 / DSM 5838 / IFAM 1418) TaxID=582402 RepID=C6XJ92_HIRBI|nr:FAD-dependent oxidoreductase [Hirschia baltica]ACT59187.1 fumarate reductase/succinate dehydrogenase flavoprotein domain protein [Hirschia baltica ATCC 49814]